MTPTEIWSILLRLESRIFELLHSMGRIEGEVQGLKSQVNRLEDREHSGHKIRPMDFLSYLPGAIALGLWALGKMSLDRAMSLLGGSGH